MRCCHAPDRRHHPLPPPQFSTGVHAVSPMGDGSRGWQITFGKQDEALQTETFDFCVIATGM